MMSYDLMATFWTSCHPENIELNIQSNSNEAVNSWTK